MRVDTIHALEYLADQTRELLGKRDANTRWQSRLVVNDALHPGHELLDVGWGRHLGRSFVVLAILP